jgi:hypothetical protein
MTSDVVEFWGLLGSSLFAGLTCTVILLVYGTLPEFDEIPWKHFVANALTSAVISESIMYFVASKLDASMISIIVVMLRYPTRCYSQWLLLASCARRPSLRKG